MPTEPAIWRPTFCLVTCEHGGNAIPKEFASLFENAQDILETHRGYDPGALPVAARLADALSLPLVHATTSRLLIDLNRSVHVHDAFSEFTRGLPESRKQHIIDRYYAGHRGTVERIIRLATQAGERVLHIGMHSCTDVLNGVARELDTSLLFDPDRKSEASFAEAWRGEILKRAPSHRVPFNEPYKGTDDGLTTTLRTMFPDRVYAGIEVELLQSRVANETGQHREAALLIESLRPLLP